MLDAELHWLMSRTRSVEENVQRETELLQQLDSFLLVKHTHTHTQTHTGTQHRGQHCAYFTHRDQFTSCVERPLESQFGLKRFQVFTRKPVSESGGVATEKHERHELGWESPTKTHCQVFITGCVGFSGFGA